jgi:hypothetical protein
VICPDVLQFRLADLGFCLRDRRRYLAALTVQASGFALQRCFAGQGHEPFLVQAVHALQFARDQLMLCRFRFYLSIETRDLFAELLDMAVQELLDASARRGAAVEQRNFRCP